MLLTLLIGSLTIILNMAIQVLTVVVLLRFLVRCPGNRPPA